MKPDPCAFFGWTRPHAGAPWVRVCCAATRELCERLLAEHDGVEKVVLQKGDYPHRWKDVLP